VLLESYTIAEDEPEVNDRRSGRGNSRARFDDGFQITVDGTATELFRVPSTERARRHRVTG